MTGEERLYTVIGKRYCGDPLWQVPQVMKTRTNLDAITYLKINIRMAFETPLCVITTMGSRNIATQLPWTKPLVPPLPLYGKSFDVLTSGSCKMDDNFTPFRPTPSCHQARPIRNTGFVPSTGTGTGTLQQTKLNFIRSNAMKAIADIQQYAKDEPKKFYTVLVFIVIISYLLFFYTDIEESYYQQPDSQYQYQQGQPVHSITT
jgi:hypothetical protein